MEKDLLRHYIRLKQVKGPVGVRQAQRLLGLNSPGKAQRVLNRLVKEGLAERRENGKYEILRDPPPELVGKVIIAGRVYPRILMYAAYATTFLAAYVVMARPPLSTVLFGILLVAPLWMEAFIEAIQLRKSGIT